MSDRENFIARWSRRKRDAEREGEAAAPSGEAKADADRNADAEQSKTSEAADAPAFDVSTLPAIESITAGTDIRAFLAAGIPPLLRQAALRRAWSADPAIRDFKGLAECDWDFNTPGSAPGFGPLPANDKLRELLLRTMTGQDKPAESAPEVAHGRDGEQLGAAEHGSATAPADGGRSQEGEGDESQDAEISNAEPTDLAATQNMNTIVDLSKSSMKRSHGSARPR